MKRLSIFLAVSLVVLLSFEGFSHNIILPSEVASKKATIEKNLMVGLTSENEGLMMSAAYFLGEYQCECAVIPLMKLLHDSDNEKVRITAALSLAKIGTEKSLYAVKQNIIFDHSEAVRKLCRQFYTAAKLQKQIALEHAD